MAIDYTFRTRVRGGEDSCRACQCDRQGGALGAWAVPHSCTTYEEPGKAAERKRRRRLAEMERHAERTRQLRAGSPAETRTRSIATTFEVH